MEHSHCFVSVCLTQGPHHQYQELLYFHSSVDNPELLHDWNLHGYKSPLSKVDKDFCYSLFLKDGDSIVQ